MNTIIKIKRDSGYADILRAYEVVLDEKVVGEIQNGQEITLEVPKGTHRLYLKIDWGRSNTVNFDASDNTIDFECGSNLRGLKILLALFYVLFLRDKYLWLKKNPNILPINSNISGTELTVEGGQVIPVLGTKGAAVSATFNAGKVAWALVIGSAIYIIINASGGSLKGLLAPFTPAPSVQTVQTSDWKTYTNSALGYQINYPSSYILDKESDKRFMPGAYQNGFSRLPSDLYIALPENSFPGTTFADATFIVEGHENMDVKECYSPTFEFISSKREVDINGNTMYVTKGGNEGTSSFGYSSEVYSIFKDNRCYEIILNVGQVASLLDPDKPRSILDSEKPFSDLRQILNTFKFTK